MKFKYQGIKEIEYTTKTLRAYFIVDGDDFHPNLFDFDVEECVYDVVFDSINFASREILFKEFKRNNILDTVRMQLIRNFGV